MASTAAGDGPIAWQPHGEGTETGTLTVPLDHDEPDGETVELFVARRRAADPEQRIGTLLVNPGGPGIGGSDAALLADRSLGAELLEHFDIVGWDPRGTGRSTPAIDCVDDLGALTTASPADAAQTFGAGCTSRSGDLLGHVGTNDSAADMDAIRQALGEDRISYLGFSYGSELGATWATAYPHTVRAAVLDGAADPTATFDERLVQRATGFEATLDRYLAHCAEDAGCAFHHDGDPGAAFDAVMAQLDASPIPSAPDRPPITRAIAAQAVVQAMYNDAFWDQLSAALAAAESGDGAGLLALWDASLLRRPDGTWPDTFEAGQVITCMDRAERFDAAALDDVDARVAAVAPRLAPGLPSAWLCSALPAPERPRQPITGAGAGPLLVIGTTGDPATPLASSQAMADALADGHLVVVDADRHTGYGANECVDDVVHRYLVDLEVPADETTC